LIARHTSSASYQAFITIFIFVAGLFLAREIGSEIVAGNLSFIAMVAIAAVLGVTGIAILRNWRLGFYLFNIWLLFEDLVRKYMGNGLAFFFGKDVLALVIYVALFIAIRKGKEKAFKPPFLLWFPLICFVWLGAMQIFNPNSPSVLYGLLGFKLDFFYIPMLYVGYALIRNSEDLRKLLVLNAILAIFVCGVGIIQGIVGNSFMNPRTLDPALAELGNLEKVTPISGQVFSLPPSVFVSTGRFGLYLAMAAIFMVGAAGYLLLYSKRNRILVFLAVGLIGVATLLSGSRTAVVYVVGSTCVLIVGLLWGAPWRWGQVHRLVKAIRWSITIGALALALAVILFPSAVATRLAFYTETLNPTSSASEVTHRGLSYPIENLLAVFGDQNWVMGNGIGTASLGTQYVARFRGTPLLTNWTEEGYGGLILEMGILAPCLWILWTSTLTYCAWKVVLRMRQTVYSPVAVSIFWFAFVLFFPMMYESLFAYQNYVNNVMVWLMLGVLFRLPELSAPVENPSASAEMARKWRPLKLGFQPAPTPATE
jgi:hypothetical protein